MRPKIHTHLRRAPTGGYPNPKKKQRNAAWVGSWINGDDPLRNGRVTLHSVVVEDRHDRPAVINRDCTFTEGSVEYAADPPLNPTAGATWNEDYSVHAADGVDQRDRQVQRSALHGGPGRLRVGFYTKQRDDTVFELHWFEHTVGV